MTVFSLDGINDIFSDLKNVFKGNTTKTKEETCTKQFINDEYFYLITIAPAFLIVIMLSFTQRRRNILLNILHGRPGLIHPMDLYTTRKRLSYACAFGSTVYLIGQIIFSKFRVIEYDGYRIVSYMIILFSVVVFGVVYLPVFVTLTVGSVYGSFLGAVYTLMLLFVQFLRLWQCGDSSKSRSVRFLGGLPTLFVLLYLTCSNFLKFALKIKNKQFSWDFVEDEFRSTSIEEIREHSCGKRVVYLLTPNWLQTKVRSKTFLQKVLNKVKDYTYRSDPDFQYSARVISTLLVGFMVTYTVAFESIWFFSRWYISFNKYVNLYDFSRNNTTIESIIHYLFNRVSLLKTMKYSFIPILIGLSIGSLLTCFGILRMLTGYRSTMFLLYKGELKDFRKDMSSANQLRSCLKYAGFQVAYIVWGWFIHCVVFSGICLIWSVFLFFNGFGEIILKILDFFWPILFWALIIYLFQFILSKYAFLEDSGKYLALTNRKALFIFNYFMFFYNIFLGIFSTLLRLAKGMVIGALVLPRLDTSTLPLDFSNYDPGYEAYIGFMKVECSLSHPVMISFIRLLMLLSKQRKLKSKSKLDFNSGREIEMKLSSEEKSRKQRAAAFNWHLIYTLINNPDLRMERRGYIHAMRKAKALGIRIPKSDGFVALDMDFLEEAEGGDENNIREKLLDFRVGLRNKIDQVKSYFTSDDETSSEEDIDERNIFHVESMM